MRPVAIVSFSATKSVRRERTLNDVEMLAPVIADAIERSGIPRSRMSFVCSGSSDLLAGLPFSFVGALDAVGGSPPISESHVEMDGAWALYEAWVRLQHGDADAALVYAFGKSSSGSIRDVLALQLDPYYVAPLFPDAISLAALQARAFLENGRYTERDLAAVVAKSRKNAQRSAHAQLMGPADIDALLAEPHLVSPLRKHDCPPISDGAAAVVLAAGDLAECSVKRPAWIRGIDHRIEPQSLGARDLARSVSTELAARHARATARCHPDTAEIHAPFSHQELLLAEALELDGSVAINPSGGALAANPIMVAGLIRFGLAAQRILDGESGCALAHATSGPCLQQNMVALLEAA